MSFWRKEPERVFFHCVPCGMEVSAPGHIKGGFEWVNAMAAAHACPKRGKHERPRDPRDPQSFSGHPS